MVRLSKEKDLHIFFYRDRKLDRSSETSIFWGEAARRRRWWRGLKFSRGGRDDFHGINAANSVLAPIRSGPGRCSSILYVCMNSHKMWPVLL
jgi:hypothetical protein